MIIPRGRERAPSPIVINHISQEIGVVFAKSLRNWTTMACDVRTGEEEIEMKWKEQIRIRYVE